MGAGRPTPQADENGAITLTIGSRLELLSLVHALIRELTGQYDFEEKMVDEVTYAVIEAGTNAIQHGNVFAADKSATFIFQVSATEIAVRVDDHGRGVDASEVQNETDFSNLLEPDGRGIYFCRECMDKSTSALPSDHGTS